MEAIRKPILELTRKTSKSPLRLDKFWEKGANIEVYLVENRNNKYAARIKKHKDDEIL